MSVGRHENITLLSYSQVEGISGYVGNFNVKIHRQARFIDEKKCTGCGKCAEVCPIEVTNLFDMGLSKRKAVYRHSAQSIPNAFTIEKRGVAPCRNACPTDQRAQGYIALIRQKRYADAYWAIRREHPFPSVCGRVCNHRCEDACSRGKYDQPVNIMGLKRFVSDWAYTHRDEIGKMREKSVVGTPFQLNPSPTGKKIAIIGAGPAGLTASLDLVRLGHSVTVFDALPVAGGMMRVGIPPHRLPVDGLDWEIQQIIDEGVHLRLNTRIDDVPGLLESSSAHLDGPYNAVLIATGAHVAKKLPIRNSNHPNNLMSLDILRRVAIAHKEGKEPLFPDLQGKRVAVLGGGNVALDTARTVLRLKASQVSMICLEPRGEMPGFQWEIGVAEEEGVLLYPGRTFKEIIVKRNKILGVRCSKINFRGFNRGRPDYDEVPHSEHIIQADIIIWAVGQAPDFSFLPTDGSINTRFPVGIQSDKEMMTTLPGVFVAGDVHRGVTFFVVDAIGEGHKVARSMDRYLRGEEGVQEHQSLPVVELSNKDIATKLSTHEAANWPRVTIKSIPGDERKANFKEVDLTMTEAEACSEAERCLRCGICSECLECLVACDRGAIDHNMQDQHLEVKVGTIILATGFKDFDPSVIPELGFSSINNVITAMQFERLINASGPTNGKVLLSNGQSPNDVAIIHCIGSRDVKYNEYCSRACCMYSLKIAQLVHDYVGANVHEIYRDMRSFGKDYEEFYNRTQQKGVNFYHGRVSSIESLKDGKLLVRWNEKFYNQPDHVLVDMVVLATGFEPQSDTAQIANLFGISRSRDGFFLEKHPKLAPVESATEGVFMAGACQSPKDIPDSVAQAGAAAAAALSLIDQGVITLDPSIAEVDIKRCAGCGQCVFACPYQAIALENNNGQQVAVINNYLCKGCGTCAAACPNKAMSLIQYDDRQLVAEMIGALA